MAKKTITTPKGTARYPWLNTADTKFGDPKYKVDLLVDSDAAEGTCAQIEDKLEDFFNDVVERESGGKYRDIYKVDLPFFEDEGQMLFRCTLNKIGKNKKTGEEWENKITFYDAKGKPIPDGAVPKIGGASVLRVSCEFNPWTRPKVEGRGSSKTTDLEVGISLRIKGVQVIEAKQGGNGPASASAMGFEEEEGYSYDPTSFDADNEGEEDEF